MMNEYLTQKWWHRHNNNAWKFWINPYSEVRVVESNVPEGKTPSQNYYYSRPTEHAAKILQESGWEYSPTGNPEFYRTGDKSKAEKALSQLGLELPVWKTDNYCYRVYWQDNMYYI